MDLEAFQQQLRTTGHYESPSKPRRTRAERWFWRSNTWYYLQLVAIVREAAGIARRGVYDNRMFGLSSLRFLRLLEACGGKVRIEGVNEVSPSACPVVFASNHMSLLETILLPCILLSHGSLSNVVKESLLSYPFLGTVLRTHEPICVTRRNPREDLKQVLVQGTRVLQGGRSVLVFPQATRTPYVSPRQFNSLAVKLAARAGVPVVPLALKTDWHGIGRVLKDIGPLHRDRVVHVKMGAPRNAADDPRSAQNDVIHFIVGNVRAWGGEVREAQTADNNKQGSRDLPAPQNKT